MAVKFNELLRENRKRVGMTQVELAQKTKIDRTYMSRLEKRNSNPSLDMVQKICDGLGMSVIDFFGGAEAKAPAIIISASQADEKEIRAYKKRGDLVPIKVFTSLDSFSVQRNLKKEYVLKYVSVDRDMFKHPEDIVGVETEEEYKFEFIIRKPILLINIVDTEIENFWLYVFEYDNHISIKRVIEMYPEFIAFVPQKIADYNAYFETSKLQQEMLREGTVITPDWLIRDFSLDGFDKSMIRGKVVGLIAKFSGVYTPIYRTIKAIKKIS